MTLLERIDQDLKQALLQGKKEDVAVLRGIKSVIQNEAINKRSQGTELTDQDIEAVLSKEVKKRQETVDLYLKANEQERANKELAEKKIIENYLPQQMSDEELQRLVDEVISSMDTVTSQQMGQIIGAVKARAGSAADGGRIAAIVKGKLG